AALPSCNRSRRRGPRGGGGPLGDAGAGTSTAAAVASTSDGALTSLAPAIVQSIHQQIQDGNAGGSGSGGGASSISPNRVATLAAAQWAEVSAAFASRQQLVRVVGCEVTAPQLIMRTGLHKEVRKKARELVRQVYGAPDDDLFPEWEVLVHRYVDLGSPAVYSQTRTVTFHRGRRRRPSDRPSSPWLDVCRCIWRPLVSTQRSGFGHGRRGFIRHQWQRYGG
ncbi:hypothetical protein Vretifemale_6190, partial [Volvox reticuliferus]